LTVAQVYALADAVGLRYRALILLAAFTSLRWAELAALSPTDIDLDARTVRVTRQLYYYEAGYSFAPPKSRAGVRVVAFPDLIVSDVRKHLEWLPSRASLVFASSTGTPLRHSNFRRRIWLPALAAVGLKGVHLHDLRQTSSLPTRARTSGNLWSGRATTVSVPRWSTCTHPPSVSGLWLMR
jgi:integrase